MADGVTPYLTSRIRLDMRMRGWNQAALAKAAGVGSGTLTRFLAGTIQTPKTAKKIADAIGKDLAEYVNESAE